MTIILIKIGLYLGINIISLEFLLITVHDWLNDYGYRSPQAFGELLLWFMAITLFILFVI